MPRAPPLRMRPAPPPHRHGRGGAGNCSRRRLTNRKTRSGRSPAPLPRSPRRHGNGAAQALELGRREPELPPALCRDIASPNTPPREPPYRDSTPESPSIPQTPVLSPPGRGEQRTPFNTPISPASGSAAAGSAKILPFGPKTNGRGPRADREHGGEAGPPAGQRTGREQATGAEPEVYGHARGSRNDAGIRPEPPLKPAGTRRSVHPPRSRRTPPPPVPARSPVPLPPPALCSSAHRK